MVFYRKYRPQKISELDSQKLQEKLYSILANRDLVPHAFLFTGPKGLGKTSTARIVAKAINCEKKSKVKSQKSKLQLKNQNFENIEPCGECEQCVSITNGSNLDVLEIDGASNRGIDEIRDLREKIRLSPIKAYKKIYIIDEVHMLTPDAFNALLKTLEEPPAHAMFIFCTTEFHKVPATIVSRCFQIQFRIATNTEIAESLKRITKGEKLEVADEVFVEIAKISDGSFREAAKILEELVSVAYRQKITKELLDDTYKVVSIRHYVDEILKSLSEKSVKNGIESISKLVEHGIDIRYFLEQLLSEIHEMLLTKVGIKNQELGIRNHLPVNALHRQVQAGELGTDEIKSLIQLFSRAHSEMKYAVIPQLPLELAVIEYCIVSTPVILGTNGARTPGRAALARMTNSDLWGNFIDAVKAQNHTIAGVLRGCSLKSFDDSTFVIETAFKFHKDKLSEEKSLQLLEQAYQEIAGKKVRVLVELKDRG